MDAVSSLYHALSSFVGDHPLPSVVVPSVVVGLVVKMLKDRKIAEKSAMLSTARNSLSDALKRVRKAESKLDDMEKSLTAALSSSFGSAPSSSSSSSSSSPSVTPYPLEYLSRVRGNDSDEFLACFEVLKNDLITDLENFDVDSATASYLVEMIEYNVLGGKMNRGISVVTTMRHLLGDKMSDENKFEAHVLGWCVEWLQAFFLVADDVMDSSITRRGQDCWYRLPQVKTKAINDSFILESAIYRILAKYFRNKSYYVGLVELFHEVSYQTELGQLIDLQCEDLDYDAFTPERHTRIVEYKTSYYSFYLPVALGMLASGIKSQREFEVARNILVKMGIYFQVQDDFLDCFGKNIGKIGTDIEDRKCGWLFVQAQKRASPAQLERLRAIYGKKDKALVEEVKTMYRNLHLEELYHEYEDNMFQELTNDIRALQSLPPSIFEAFLKLIFKRQK